LLIELPKDPLIFQVRTGAFHGMLHCESLFPAFVDTLYIRTVIEEWDAVFTGLFVVGDPDSEDEARMQRFLGIPYGKCSIWILRIAESRFIFREPAGKRTPLQSSHGIEA
jgi:hypothetical protein